MFYQTTYLSPIGTIALACDEGEHLVGAWIKGQKYYPDPLTMEENDQLPILETAKKWLDRYFKGEKPHPSELPLAPNGSEFRKRIWRQLCGIPYGQVISYGDIAKKIAVEMGRETMSSQAIGGAVGHNPISIIIPCHRVVGSSGSLTGFAAGIQAKIDLLTLEGVDFSTLFAPKQS